MYKRKGALNVHIRFVHLGIRKHVCDTCGIGYPRIEDLRNHLKHDLCDYSPDRLKIRIDHDDAVKQLKNFLYETKTPKSLQSEATIPNGRVVDLLVRCPDNRLIGFDITIGRSDANNLRNAIQEKYSRGYEQFCDSIYIIAISGVKNALQTIQICDRSPLKPKKTRVIHWHAIIRDNPKYVQIFQQIEDEASL